MNIEDNLDNLLKFIEKSSKLKKKEVNNYINAIQTVSEEFINLDSISGLVVGGSVGRGFLDSSSDIEMYAYCNEKLPESNKIEKVIHRLNVPLTRSSDYLWHHPVWGTHTFFQKNNISFEFGYRIIPDVIDKISNYLDGKDIFPHITKEADTPFGHYTSGLVNCISESKLLWEDKDLLVSDLKAKTKGFSPKLKKTIINFYLNEAETMRKVKLNHSVERDDSLAFNAQLASIIRSMNICLFAINEVHFPGDKWNKNYIEKFKIIPPNYLNNINSLLNDSNEGFRNKAKKYLTLENTLDWIKSLYDNNI